MIYPQKNILSDVPRGYVLNPKYGLFSVILPVASTNMIINPSIERDVANYAAASLGVTLERTDEQQRWGAYSLKTTPSSATTSGVYYGAGLAFVEGTTYTASIYFLGQPGRQYRMFFSEDLLTPGNPIGTILPIRGTGRWQYRYLTYTETTTATRRVYITKNGGSETLPFYTDGWQVEALPYPTTYFDGDMVGFVKNINDFLWTGAPHASTSTRSATTRAGGRVVNLNAYRFALLGILGLGFGPVINVAQPYVLIGGSNYQRTVPQDRVFSLAGQLDADTPQHLKQLRADLEDAFDVNLTGIQQPFILRYQDYKDDEEASYPLDIPCEYVDGLGGNVDNDYAERVGITFVSHLPYAQSAYEAGVQLDFADSLASVNRIMQRNTSGDWGLLGTGAASGSVKDFAYGLDGSLYAVGSFSSMGGVASTIGIARWDPITLTWNSVGGGVAAAGVVNAIVVTPNGDIVIGGLFSDAGGIADTTNIARWDGSNWTPLGTGTNGNVADLAVSADGGIFLTGSFLLAGGIANTVRIAKWTGSAYQALSTGLNAAGTALAYAGWGELYVGGGFSTAGGTSAAFIAKWNGSVFTALGSGLDNAPNKLLIGPDGRVYALGPHTTAGGITVNGTSVWNGTSWAALGSGVGGGLVTVYSGAFSPQGDLHIGGNFVTAGGITIPDGLALWNGSSWVLPDVDPPGTASVFSMIFSRQGDFTIGLETTGTATVAGTVTATVRGTAPTYPKIFFKGGGRIFALTNVSTGKSIYFNLTLNDTEEATLDLTPDRVTFTSTWRGNILNTIMPGSDLATWKLKQGSNIISLLMTGTTASTTSSMWWTESYKSINGATPQ